MIQMKRDTSSAKVEFLDIISWYFSVPTFYVVGSSNKQTNKKKSALEGQINKGAVHKWFRSLISFLIDQQTQHKHGAVHGAATKSAVVPSAKSP